MVVDTHIGVGLYQRLLGDGVEQLAPVVRAVHCGSGPVQGHGSLEVRRTHLLAWVAARWFTFPPAGSVVPLQLSVARTPRGETWTRRFGGRALITEQYAGAGGELVERAGRGELRFRLDIEQGGLCFRPLGAAVHVGRFRVPIPSWLAPHVAGRRQRRPAPTPVASRSASPLAAHSAASTRSTSTSGVPGSPPAVAAC